MSAIIIKEGEEEAVCGDCVDISIHAHTLHSMWKHIHAHIYERVEVQNPTACD